MIFEQGKGTVFSDIHIERDNDKLVQRLTEYKQKSRSINLDMLPL